MKRKQEHALLVAWSWTHLALGPAFMVSLLSHWSLSVLCQPLNTFDITSAFILFARQNFNRWRTCG